MNVDYREKHLEQLTIDTTPIGFKPEVVAAYHERIEIIRAAPDESVFENLTFLKYRKLRGRGNRAMHLFSSYELLLKICRRGAKLTALIESIEKSRRTAA